MTIPPITTLSDEMLREIEGGVTRLSQGSDNYLCLHKDKLRALLAERAELKRDRQMLADIRSTISRHWRPASVGASVEKDLLMQKIDARLSEPKP